MRSHAIGRRFDLRAGVLLAAVLSTSTAAGVASAQTAGNTARRVNADTGSRVPAEDASVVPARPQPVKIVWWGSSSSGMLRRSMDQVLKDHFQFTYRPGGIWFRADWMSKELEAGETAKYERMIERARDYAGRSKDNDYGAVQVSGGIFWSPEAEKHAVRVVDDMGELINKSGATPLIFEHWTSRDPAKMRQYCIAAARKHKGKVAFCGSTSAEVIAEKGKRFIGGGEGHTNARGLYLWSCCMYACLSGKSPRGLPLPPDKPAESDPRDKGQQAPLAADAKGKGAPPPIVVTQEDAEYLQNKAWQVYQKYNPLLQP